MNNKNTELGMTDTTLTSPTSASVQGQNGRYSIVSADGRPLGQTDHIAINVDTDGDGRTDFTIYANRDGSEMITKLNADGHSSIPVHSGHDGAILFATVQQAAKAGSFSPDNVATLDRNIDSQNQLFVHAPVAQAAAPAIPYGETKAQYDQAMNDQNNLQKLGYDVTVNGMLTAEDDRKMNEAVHTMGVQQHGWSGYNPAEIAQMTAAIKAAKDEHKTIAQEASEGRIFTIDPNTGAGQFKPDPARTASVPAQTVAAPPPAPSADNTAVSQTGSFTASDGTSYQYTSTDRETLITARDAGGHVVRTVDATYDQDGNLDHIQDTGQDRTQDARTQHYIDDVNQGLMAGKIDAEKIATDDRASRFPAAAVQASTPAVVPVAAAKPASVSLAGYSVDKPQAVAAPSAKPKVVAGQKTSFELAGKSYQVEETLSDIHQHKDTVIRVTDQKTGAMTTEMVTYDQQGTLQSAQIVDNATGKTTQLNMQDKQVLAGLAQLRSDVDSLEQQPDKEPAERAIAAAMGQPVPAPAASAQSALTKTQPLYNDIASGPDSATKNQLLNRLNDLVQDQQNDPHGKEPAANPDAGRPGNGGIIVPTAEGPVTVRADEDRVTILDQFNNPVSTQKDPALARAVLKAVADTQDHPQLTNDDQAMLRTVADTALASYSHSRVAEMHVPAQPHAQLSAPDAAAPQAPASDSSALSPEERARLMNGQPGQPGEDGTHWEHHVPKEIGGKTYDIWQEAGSPDMHICEEGQRKKDYAIVKSDGSVTMHSGRVVAPASDRNGLKLYQQLSTQSDNVDVDLLAQMERQAPAPAQPAAAAPAVAQSAPPAPQPQVSTQVAAATLAPAAQAPAAEHAWADRQYRRATAEDLATVQEQHPAAASQDQPAKGGYAAMNAMLAKLHFPTAGDNPPSKDTIIQVQTQYAKAAHLNEEQTKALVTGTYEATSLANELGLLGSMSAPSTPKANGTGQANGRS